MKTDHIYPPASTEYVAALEDLFLAVEMLSEASNTANVEFASESERLKVSRKWDLVDKFLKKVRRLRKIGTGGRFITDKHISQCLRKVRRKITKNE